MAKNNKNQIEAEPLTKCDHKTVWEYRTCIFAVTICDRKRHEYSYYARHSSKPRNRNIANAFFKAGFIDTWGRGFQKNQDGFEPAGIPMPKVENFCGGVRVTLVLVIGFGLVL